MIVMDLSQAFKQAIRKALGNPLIIADRFHFMRQVYWALNEVRREVQKELPKKRSDSNETLQETSLEVMDNLFR